jgi:NADPH:quinone reductase-like Zn-dependent oxidoreductase
MKALLLDAEQQTAHVKNIPIPTPAPNEIRVRVQAIALNPVDSLYVFNPLGSTGRLIGSDFAGVVDTLGEAVSVSDLNVGDRVAGFLQGACSVNERPGAFAEYLVCPWDLVWKISSAMRFEDAATVSLCGLTAAQALFFRMGLRAPFGEMTTTQQLEPREPLACFIYGATTSVGMYAAQLIHAWAKSSGVPIQLFGTASKKHFAMLKSQPYCYTELVDYHNRDWPAEILQLADGKGVDYAYDCISEGDTVAATSRILKPGGQMAIVRSREGGAWTPGNLAGGVEPSYGAVWEGLGVDVQYQGMRLDASRKARDFAVAYYRWLDGGGMLRPNPVRMMPGGLEGVVEDGFRLLGSGTMGQRDSGRGENWMRPLSAEKIVYRVGAE